MSITELITAIGVIISLLAVVVTVVLYRIDQYGQLNVHTREDLQAIYAICGQFLHPLREDVPDPILLTATAITKELCSRLGESPKGKDVLELLHNKDLLFAICAEGWSSSTQMSRMMDLIEELENKATSRYLLSGKLLLISQASLLLAAIMARAYSPKTFYNILIQLKLESCKDDDAKVFRDTIAFELQQRICNKFHDQYIEVIKSCLYFIQLSSSALLQFSDRDLANLTKEYVTYGLYSRQTENISDDPNLFLQLEQANSIHSRINQVKQTLNALKSDIPQDYQILLSLIERVFTADFSQ